MKLARTPPNEWVSVEDAMPPELKMVLVYCSGLYCVAGWVRDEPEKFYGLEVE